MVDLDKFVEQCQATLESSDPSGGVEALVREVISDPEGLRDAFAKKVTGTTIQDRIIFHSDDLTVVQISTSPGLRSPVHNHNMWAVIGVYDGEEHNRFFENRAGGLEQSGERLLHAGDIAVLEPDTIHAISNPLDRKSHAIHVYGGDLTGRAGRSMWNPTTSEREDYEITRLSQYTKALSATP